jgi:hypothetical protein
MRLLTRGGLARGALWVAPAALLPLPLAWISLRGVAAIPLRLLLLLLRIALLLLGVPLLLVALLLGRVALLLRRVSLLGRVSLLLVSLLLLRISLLLIPPLGVAPLLWGVSPLLGRVALRGIALLLGGVWSLLVRRRAERIRATRFNRGCIIMVRQSIECRKPSHVVGHGRGGGGRRRRRGGAQRHKRHRRDVSRRSLLLLLLRGKAILLLLLRSTWRRGRGGKWIKALLGETSVLLGGALVVRGSLVRRRRKRYVSVLCR